MQPSKRSSSNAAVSSLQGGHIIQWAAMGSGRQEHMDMVDLHRPNWGACNLPLQARTIAIIDSFDRATCHQLVTDLSPTGERVAIQLACDFEPGPLGATCGDTDARQCSPLDRIFERFCSCSEIL